MDGTLDPFFLKKYHVGPTEPWCRVSGEDRLGKGGCGVGGTSVVRAGGEVSPSSHGCSGSSWSQLPPAHGEGLSQKRCSSERIVLNKSHTREHQYGPRTAPMQSSMTARSVSLLSPFLRITRRNPNPRRTLLDERGPCFVRTKVTKYCLPTVSSHGANIPPEADSPH